MTQYLLSVHHDFAADIDRDEAAQNEAFAKVGAFNAAPFMGGFWIVEAADALAAQAAAACGHVIEVRALQG